MVMRSINNTFNRGELDPTLFSRDDSDIYAKGARKLRNMISLWTGAARIAPGTRYVDVLVDRENANAPITNAQQVTGVDFLYSAEDNIIYTIIIRPSGSVSAIDIYYDNTLQATITSGVTYTPATIKDLRFVAAQDRLLILDKAYPIKQLKRGASHASWTFTTLTPSIYPTFDYSVIGEAINYRAFTFTLGATTGSGITLTSSGAVFDAGHVGGTFIGNGGVARITAVASTTSATVNILDDFVSTTVAGELASLREKLWSDGGGPPTSTPRGWPSVGVFFNNRLILAGNLFLGNIVAVSTAGVFDNFDDSIIDALSSFSVTLNAGSEQTIQSVVADDTIMFTTTNKIFAQSPLVENPLTASNVYFAPQTQAPAADIEAVTIDNQTLFVAANQSQIMQLMYKTELAKYIAVPASLLSGHLFETVNSNGTWEPKGIDTRLYMATQENGTMAMYSTLSEQQVAGWSLRDTRGKLNRVIAGGRQAHVIAGRQINLGSSTFETALDYAYNSDPLMKAFADIQSDLASGAVAIGVLENQNDFLVLGNEIPFTALDFVFNLASTDDLGLTFEYLDGNGFWDTFTPTDNTTGMTADGSIVWTFDDVLNWQPNTVNGIEQTYWIRIKRTTETVTDAPVVLTVGVNTGERLYLERMSFDLYSDSTTVGANSDQNGLVTGLTHLAGHQVYAITDGYTTGPYFVDDGGETTIKQTNATVDIGIQYVPLLVPMPLYVPTQEGDNMYAQKYVQDLYIDYVDSLYLKAGITPEITDIPNMKLGNYTLGQPVAPQTGIYKITPRGDWQPRQEITITQSQPGPMTIIGVGYHVEVT